MRKIRHIWSQWKRLTRFHNVAHYIMQSEADRSRAFPLICRTAIQMQGVPFSNKFKLKLSEYDESLADKNLLSEMVLVLSWAYFEDHCRTILDESLADGLLTDWREEYWSGGVGQWGDRLLKARGQDWKNVSGGRALIIEASVLRNAIAHGQQVYTQKMLNRITDAGGTSSKQVGEKLVIDFEGCEKIRATLKSYARLIESKKKSKTV